MCRDYGVAEPDIEVSESWVTTIFRRPGSDVGSRAESMENRIIKMLYHGPMSKSVISRELGKKTVTGHLNRAIRQLLSDEYIEFTIPEKPSSRLQRYRLANKGKEFLLEESEKSR